LLWDRNQMANRQDLHDVVEELPASELDAALRFLRFLCYDGLDEEPVDAETVAKLDAARAEGGQPVALDEVKRRYGL
jgi:hypothetical protein